MSSTVPDGAQPASPDVIEAAQPASPDVLDAAQPASPDVLEAAPPASPDVLEEMEEEMLNMLDGLDSGAVEAGGSSATASGEVPAEPESLANGTKEVAEGLDDEVADALEDALFGDGADVDFPPPPDPFDSKTVAGDMRDEDFSETELFGEELPAQKEARKAEVQADRAAATAAKGGIDEEAEIAYKEARREEEEGTYDDKTSRYTKDAKGNLMFKWICNYAPRAGGAQCKDADCLERHDQGGVRTIEKGCLRIGRRILMNFGHGDDEPQVTMMWHHARCMFNTFLRARKTTRTIESEFDIENFATITAEDQEMLRKIIENNDSTRTARFRTFGGNATTTPQKRSATDPLIGSGAKKKRLLDPETRLIKPGDRVWTHFRCAPKLKEGETPPALPPGAGFATVKSLKPELAMIRASPETASVIVQFESEEHEKERIELYKSKRGNKIRGWLRFPRLFEGRKQRVELNWVQWKRDPPALCGCKEQSWAHKCDCGISCGRGSAVKVWGVGSNAGFC